MKQLLKPNIQFPLIVLSHCAVSMLVNATQPNDSKAK